MANNNNSNISKILYKNGQRDQKLHDCIYIISIFLKNDCSLLFSYKTIIIMWFIVILYIHYTLLVYYLLYTYTQQQCV